MRAFLRRHPWFSAVMAMLLLFATSGTSITRMTCLSGGHSVLAVGLIGDCCPDEEHDGDALLATCCDFGSATSPVEDLLPGGSGEYQLLPFTLIPDGAAVKDTAPLRRIGWLQTRPPSHNAPDRLSRLGSWLI